MTNIAQAPAPTTIIFGTDGWRAKVADDFTFDNVRRCADGVARYVVDRGEGAKGVVIAYDRRFASEHFAAAAAEVLMAHDIPIAFAVHAVPTQMSSYEVVQRGAAAGIVITASHNPWTDNGFKVKAPSGAAAGPEILGVIEAQIARNGGTAIERRPFADGEAAGLVDRFDPFAGYEAYLRRSVDLDSLKDGDVTILVDPMYGAGAGWIPRLLAGGRIRVTEIHQERNPYFGGINPEPIRPHIDEALGILANGGYDLGLLLDGDADRAGAADEKGTFIHQLQVTGLLMYYLAEHRGMREPVVVSVNNTATAARLGERYGIETHETPVGFKFIGPKMIETGRDDGRRGIRGLRLRDAPAGAGRDLCRPAAARPLPPGEGGRPLAALEGGRAFPRDRRAVLLPPDRRPRPARRIRRGQAAAPRRPRRQRPDRARRPAGDQDSIARHE